MKPRQFMESLRRQNLAPVYFFCGPDRFLHEQCREALLASLPQEARAWSLLEHDFRSSQLAGILEQAYQMPMMGGRTFHLIRDVKDRALKDFDGAQEEDYEALEGYLKRPALFSCLVFIAFEPDERRRFITLLKKKTQVVEMQPPDLPRAVEWVEDYLAGQGVGIEREDAEELVESFGPDLVWIRTELEKVLTARPGVKRLSAEDLGLAVSLAEEHELGKFLRALAEREAAMALAGLDDLLASREPELRILWQVGFLFRLSLAETGGGGYSSRHWRPNSAQALAPVVAKNYSRAERIRALSLVHEADDRIKSSWKDSRLALEYLVWQIVGAEKRASGALSGGSSHPPQGARTRPEIL